MNRAMNHPPASHAAMRRGRAARGFTLIETALATVIVGVGVLAMVAAQQAFHKQNHWSTQVSTATWLANEIREMTLHLPRHDPVTGTAVWGPEANEPNYLAWNDLDDFDGAVFSADDGDGPLNARREVIYGMPGWAQTVHVYNVDPFEINRHMANGSTTMMKVEVVVTYRPPGARDSDVTEMIRVSWISPN